ncbi:hypothetical protein ACTG2K_19090 [Aeromonas caviae]
MLGLCQLLQLGAGDPAQLLHRALDNDPVTVPKTLSISRYQISHGVDALS